MKKYMIYLLALILSIICSFSRDFFNFPIFDFIIRTGFTMGIIYILEFIFINKENP